MCTMVVLVTGASGYLGRAVVAGLAAAGHQVRALAADLLADSLGPQRAGVDAHGTLSHADINGPGTAIRDFVHITDAAAAIVAALSSVHSGHRVYNVGAVPASVNDILAATREVTGRPIPVVHHPPHPG